MPCPCETCTCGDSCTCTPGAPGCDACGAFQRAKASPNKPFTLIVNMTFSDSDAEQTFLESMVPYAKWVNENEPNTLEYQLMKSDKPDKGICYGIIERYADKERYGQQLRNGTRAVLGTTLSSPLFCVTCSERAPRRGTRK